MKAEEKAMELYPIEDFPFREDAESQYKLRAAFLKGYEYAKQQPEQGEVDESDIELLWSLMPKWVKENPAPDGLDPTFYGTLSKKGDQKLIDRVGNIFLNLKSTLTQDKVREAAEKVVIDYANLRGANSEHLRLMNSMSELEKALK